MPNPIILDILDVRKKAFVECNKQANTVELHKYVVNAFMYLIYFIFNCLSAK